MSLANTYARSLDALGPLGAPVDAVGVDDRVARLNKRSIKKESKLRALEMALAMIDLTTLEGADTPGKVNDLCAKARRLHSGCDFDLPHVAAVCVYPTLVAHAKRRLEGTGQLVCAWNDRHRGDDRRRAQEQLAVMRSVQSTLGQGQRMGGAPLPAAGGLVAASSLIDTGFGFGYFQVQHVGATSWYLMGALATNPYQPRGLR